MKFWTTRNRRRQAQRSPWQMLLERLEDRTLMTPTITPLAEQKTLEDTPKTISGVLFTSTINPITVTLSVTDGTLTVTTPLTGGVTSEQITRNGTNSVSITGNVADINETLATGLEYKPRTNFFDTDSTDSLVININNLSETFESTTALTVNGVNDRPTFTIGSGQIVLQGSAIQNVENFATLISPGPNESTTQATDFFTVTNDNNSLFSTQPTISPSGKLTYTPALNAFGTATVTVLLHDDGGTTHGGFDSSLAQTFTITITKPNAAPSSAKGPDQKVIVNSGAQTVTSWATGILAGPADESTQTLNFIVTTDKPALFSAPPTIAANGNLTYTPATNAKGTATVTVQIHDNGGTTNGGVDSSATQTFTITIGNGPLPVVANVAYTAKGNARLRAFVVDGLLTVQINGVPYPTYAPEGIESLTIIGGPGVDQIDLSGLLDTVYSKLSTVVIKGGSGNDRIVGSFANDSIDAGAGNDTVSGGLGDDLIQGGAGTDLLIESSDVDFELTNTTLDGGLGTDTLLTIENVSLTGGDGGNTIDASAFTKGAVTLIGGAGNDVIKGGSGNDAISGRDGDDEIFGGGGNDTLLGGFGNDILNGEAGNDLLIGGFDDDELHGGTGNDTAVGGQGGASRGGNGEKDSGDIFTSVVINEAFKKLFAFE